MDKIDFPVSIRLDTALCFANMRFVEECLQSMLAERQAKWVVFDLVLRTCFPEQQARQVSLPKVLEEIGAKERAAASDDPNPKKGGRPSDRAYLS